MKPHRHTFFFTSLLLLFAVAGAGTADALQFRLRWVDKSKNEDGFKIERKRGKGAYAAIAVLTKNSTSYVDSKIAPGAAYCYRIRAYNSRGSAVSNPACATTRADLTIARAGSGGGRVVSAPAGINCGSKCKATFTGLSPIKLIAVPAAGSVFKGWSGAKDCRNGVVTMNGNKRCIANFHKVAPGRVGGVAAASLTAAPQSPVAGGQRRPISIGIFRPGTGEWFLDNDSGLIGACKAAICARNLGGAGDLPVVGAWTGAEATFLGLFDRATASWSLDRNGNGVFDGCEANACRRIYGQPGDVPVAGDWTGGGQVNIGVFSPGSGTWRLDVNGDGDFDACDEDLCARTFGAPGDLPVVGDWDGGGQTRIGVFRPGTGEWFLDFGDGVAAECAGDCIIFGASSDLPVVGDWDGSGTDKIGVFRPATGEWLLDLNGDGSWDGCAVDLCLGPFGAPGDLPVVGSWQ